MQYKEDKSSNFVPNFFRASAEDFKKIPGSPIAYWVSERVREIFEKNTNVSSCAKCVKGLDTCDNDKFLRFWVELNKNNSCIQDSIFHLSKWFPYAKGGGYKKWYGNNEFLVNWENDGYELKNLRNKDGSIKSRPQNIRYYFKEGITFGSVTSSQFSARYLNSSIFGGGGNALFYRNYGYILCLLNSIFCGYILKALNPTLNFLVNDLLNVPFLQIDEVNEKCIIHISSRLIALSKSDWDAYETSWDFTTLPLLAPHEYPLKQSLEEAYAHLREQWKAMTLEMQALEEENNRIFIEAYGLHEELTPEVPLHEITLTCNPWYRYGVICEVHDPSTFSLDPTLEARLQEDTIKELISYGVGCMFGRYSLDQAGLILANQGEGLETYLQAIPHPLFTPDEDNVIPILEEAWFANDMTEQFQNFLKVVFGSESYEANLHWIEQNLGKPLRKYFFKDFYADHIKRYKKRPIYWLFSSPKGTFNALIYMHRYTPQTLSIVLNTYLKEFISKLKTQKQQMESLSINPGASSVEKTKALKTMESLKKTIAELEEYEHQVLYPLAIQHLAIDLDDGVKVNYPKFGTALKKIPGLDTEEE